MVKDSQLHQSMSRRTNCRDNAPQEGFFGHMKDEIDLSDDTCFAQIRQAIRTWPTITITSAISGISPAWLRPNITDIS